MHAPPKQSPWACLTIITNLTTPPFRTQIRSVQLLIITRVTKEPVSQKMRAKHFTLPLELYYYARENKYLKTSLYIRVLYTKIFS